MGRHSKRSPPPAEFHPWRRDVAFEPAAHGAPIEPMKARLSIITDNPNWGMVFRRGHLEISEADALVIAESMGIRLASS